MATQPLHVEPAANSLDALWANTLGDKEAQAAPMPAEPSLTAADVAAFVSSIEGQLDGWGKLFTQVPAEHKRRKEALGGALKIKAAAKKFEAVKNSLAAPEGDDCKAELSDLMVECQAAFHETVHGVLEASFPLDEVLTHDKFSDEASLAASVERMRLLPALTTTLGELFAKGRLEPKSLSASGAEGPIAPEMMKMLEKQMKKQKKKDQKKKEKKGITDEPGPLSDEQKVAAKAIWAQTRDGRCSSALGEEVWEGLNWRRGIFLFAYIQCLLGEKDHGAPDDGEERPEPQNVSRELFTDAMLSFHALLLAQGPVSGDMDDHATQWLLGSDGGLSEETPRLFYHGIYTSTHLRGLKHLAELAYWQWTYHGKTASDATLACLVNRKFAHVVRHIMPHAGWTADIEYERILEMEKAPGSVGSSEFSAGLETSGPKGGQIAQIANNASVVEEATDEKKPKKKKKGKSKDSTEDDESAAAAAEPESGALAEAAAED